MKTKNSRSLTYKQRLLLFEWTAEKLQLWEINQRAAKEDPPFQVEWPQLKHARKRLGVYIRDRTPDIAEAAARGDAVAAARDGAALSAKRQ
jgi:hypothetical protein